MYDYNAGTRQDWRDEGMYHNIPAPRTKQKTAAREENCQTLWSFLVWAAPLAILVGLVAGQVHTDGYMVFLWFGCLGFLISRILRS